MATTKRQKRNMNTSSNNDDDVMKSANTRRRRSPRLMNNVNTSTTTSTSLASTFNENERIQNDTQTKTKKNTKRKSKRSTSTSAASTTATKAKSSTKTSYKKQKKDPQAALSGDDNENASNIKREEEGEAKKKIEIHTTNEERDDSFDKTTETTKTKTEIQSNHLSSNMNTPLLDLGTLVKGILVKRPSATVRSPYVADVRLLTNDKHEKGNDDGDEEEEEVIVQAHSPALDVGGLCCVGATVYMSVRPPGGKTSHSIELLQAPGPNSGGSVSSVGGDDHVLVGCHPNLGEKLAEEVLKRGLLQSSLGFGIAEAVKTSKKKKKKSSTTKASTNSTKKRKKDNDQNDDNKEEEHDNQKIIKEDNTTKLYKQRTYGDSRIDFELIKEESITNTNSEKTNYHHTNLKRRRALIEVKNVVCSDYSAQFAPIKTGPNHCVIIAPETMIKSKEENENDNNDNKSDATKNEELIPYQRSGIFPWGRVGQTFEGKKVVSERAIKHLRNLAMLTSKRKTKDMKQQNEQGNNGFDPDEEEDHCQTVVLFVLNRSDCVRMRACHEACSVFANELKATHDKGTLVLCFRTRWTEEGKAYFDGMVPVSV